MADLIAALTEAMTAPVGPPCCDLAGRTVHHHWPTSPGTSAVLLIPETCRFNG